MTQKEFCKYNEIGDFCEHKENKDGICDADKCPLMKG